MLIERRHVDDDGNVRRELTGDAETTVHFTREILDAADGRYLELDGNLVTLRDDDGRVVRYRITGSGNENVPAELVIS